MDYDKLIEQLRSYTYWLGQSGPESHDIHPAICGDAAIAIEAQQIENQALRNTVNGFKADLARVTAERDAAVKDLNEFLSMDELCPVQCEWCKWNGTYCDGKTPEWRGQKEG